MEELQVLGACHSRESALKKKRKAATHRSTNNSQCVLICLHPNAQINPLEVVVNISGRLQFMDFLAQIYSASHHFIESKKLFRFALSTIFSMNNLVQFNQATISSVMLR